MLSPPLAIEFFASDEQETSHSTRLMKNQE